MANKKTHEEFISEVYNLVRTEYSVLTKYINNKTKIKIRHNNCGYIWDIKYIKILKMINIILLYIIIMNIKNYKEKKYD